VWNTTKLEKTKADLLKSDYYRLAEQSCPKKGEGKRLSVAPPSKVSLLKAHPLIRILNSTLVDLPAPANLSVNWNYGSLLGLVLVIQFIRGIILTTRYSAHISTAFDSVVYICHDVALGWLVRLAHSTGASFFFLFLYLHIGRGLYYGSYCHARTWNLGVLIYLVLIGTAFLGYVLPWGQMSYWAATVITNLLSAIPVVGKLLVEWVWGGFAISNATLVRFYTLHFLLPFFVLVLVLLHIFHLHSHGRSNPLGVSSSRNKVPFHYYFSAKDRFVYVIFLFAFAFVTLAFGYSLIDSVNWVPANSLVTPKHIQPEWYFLFAYAILRSIPNKLGGVVALLAAVFILFLFPPLRVNSVSRGFNSSPLARFVFWSFIACFILLTWLGSCPAASPFNEVGLLVSFIWFSLALTLAGWSSFWRGALDVGPPKSHV
jgi:ubiquinol-cytochrome c reductase cytochrome b subunit